MNIDKLDKDLLREKRSIAMRQMKNYAYGLACVLAENGH